MNSRLFCYGTLQAKEIFQSITGMDPESEKAVLKGFSCYRVKSAVYPGIIKSSGDEVTGTIYKGLNSIALEKLDRFEGALYERRLVTVTGSPRDRGQPIQAWTYVIKTGCQHLLTREPWHYDDYEPRFLERFRGFRDV